jgi:hypothetical protein
MRSTASPQDRVASRLDKETLPGCWLYTGSVQFGYGVVSDRANGSTGRKAHRVAYEMWVGPIPAGVTVDHECHNVAFNLGECEGGECLHRRCCNPDHLVLRTQRDNTLRGNSPSAINARKTGCPQGHLYDEANTYLHDGHRYCRQCIRERRSK